MDNKTQFKALLFIQSYNVFKYPTRWVLMSLIRYQQIFNLEDTFVLNTISLKSLFDIEPSKLDRYLDYFKNGNWLSYSKQDNDKYNVTINYEKIIKRRNDVIFYSNLKKNKK